MSERTTTELISLMEATNAIEAIGDVIETNLVNLGLGRIDQQIVVSDETRRRIEAMHDAVLESFDLAIAAMAEVDLDTARTVRNRKALVVDLEQQALEYQAERLMADEPKRGRTYRFEIDVVHNLTRIHYFARRVARTVLPIAERATEGADETSSSPSGTASADRE
jgi:phosphate:Na+ symporter